MNMVLPEPGVRPARMRAVARNFTNKTKEIPHMTASRYLLPGALILTLAILSACGGSGGSSPSQTTYDPVQTATYKVEYLPVTTAVDGKSSYKIRVSNRTTVAAVAGKTITLVPTMHMTSMSHSTPFEALKDNGDGTYFGTIYYLMASQAADGTSMGTWELAFAVDGETAAFNPVVTISTGTTSRVTLKGVSDKVGSMTSATSRTYYLFNDGMPGGSVKLFIAAVDNAAKTSYPAVSAGTVLHDQTGANWPVASALVEVSTDKTNWTPLGDDNNGHWSKTGLPALSASSHLYVRLTVNGEQKTTDGAPLSAANGAADFTISSGQ